METRNRKRFRPNALAPWELRIAVGRKLGNRLMIGGLVLAPDIWEGYHQRLTVCRTILSSCGALIRANVWSGPCVCPP
jgi:hypothetical protein